MGHTPTNQPGPIGHHFAGIAANESFGMHEAPPHEWIIDSLNQDIPMIFDSFHNTMTDVLRQMDIDYAIVKQTGMIDGEKLRPGQTPEKSSIELACWRSLESSLWILAVQSFHDYTMQNDPEKYKRICQTMNVQVAETLLDRALIQDARASQEVGFVFQQAFLNEVDALSRLKAMITHNIPNVQVEIEIRTQELDGRDIQRGNDEPRFLMTPVVVLTALKDKDLRIPLRRYVDQPQGAGPAGLMPV